MRPGTWPGARIEARLPLPLPELNALLAEVLQSHQQLSAVVISVPAADRLVLEIVTTAALPSLGGLNWIAQSLLGLDLNSGRLRVELEVVPGAYRGEDGGFLLFRFPPGMAGLAQATLLSSQALQSRLPAAIASALVVEGRNLKVQVQPLLELSGLERWVGRPLALDVRTSPGVLWLEARVTVPEHAVAHAEGTGDGQVERGAVAKPQSGEVAAGGAVAAGRAALQGHLQDGLSRLRGLDIQGEIPVGEALLNHAIGDVLSGLQKEPANKPAPLERDMGAAGLPISKLVRHVQRAEIGLEAGHMVLRFRFLVA